MKTDMLLIMIRNRSTPAILALSMVQCAGCVRPDRTALSPQLIRFQVVQRCDVESNQRGEQSPSIYDPLINEIKLTLAANEATGFLVQLQADSVPYAELALSAAALTGESGALDGATVRLSRVLSVDVGPLPGWHIKGIAPQDRFSTVPDILVPISSPRLGQPYTLNAGDRIYLWVDVSVPASAPPGRYRSAIRITERGAVSANIPISVSVLPIVLPDDPGIALLAPVDLHRLLGHHLEINGEPFAPERLLKNAPLYDQSAELVRRTLLLLREHSLSPFLTGLYPIAKTDDQGELRVKWDDYDDLIGPFLDGELLANPRTVKYWPVPFDETFPTPPPYDALTSPTYARTLRQYLAQCGQHFQDRGWSELAFVLLPPRDATYTEATFHATRSYAEIERLSGRKFPLVSPLPPQDLRPYGWDGYPFQDLSGYVDVWCPAAQFFDRAVFDQPQFRQTRQWLRLDRPPFSGSLELAAPDSAIRVIPWQAVQLRAEAVLLPTVNDWSLDYAPTSPAEQLRRTPTPLIVPGKSCGLDAPLATLRLKMLRQGMHDAAYLRLCREQGMDEIHDLLVQSLCPRAGVDSSYTHFEDGRFDAWSGNPRTWDLAVELMAAGLSQKIEARSDAQDPFQSIGWQEFLEAVQGVRSRPLGARVNLESARSGGVSDGFRVELSLAIENATPRDISATIGFGELPLGWQAELDQVTVELVPRFSSQTVNLRARADAIPAGDDGKLQIPVILNCDGANPQTSWVQVSHLTVRRLIKPIRVDGNLDDWPLGVGNVARRFSPISTGSAAAPGIESDPQTGENVIVWACSDREHLYIAFHCLKPHQYLPSRVQNNFVEYQDRVPVGEELLEILLDPTNSGATSPADLLHIVIKPSGAVYRERGIRCRPQVGQAEDWPAQIDAATRLLEDRWIGEVRIPLAALGPSGSGPRSIGINFCHFDADAWTYSTWSGALWNAYNPASLGNMTFPR